MIPFRNQVLQRDVLEVLNELPPESVDMIYGDPDYNVGINYAGQNYTRKWEEYIDWYVELNRACMRVLKPTGNLFMMNYPKQNAYLRVRFLDEAAFMVQEYVWVYNTNVGHSKKRFTTAHRSILHATKTADNQFYKNHVAQPYLNPNDKRIKKRMENGDIGRMPYSWLQAEHEPDEVEQMSWFYFNLVKNVSKDKTFHACQIPLALVEMLIKASTQENDDVFILFGGSGSEALRCRDLNRNFLSCEIHPEYYALIQHRLKNPEAKILDLKALQTVA